MNLTNWARVHPCFLSHCIEPSTMEPGHEAPAWYPKGKEAFHFAEKVLDHRRVYKNDETQEMVIEAHLYNYNEDPQKEETIKIFIAQHPHILCSVTDYSDYSKDTTRVVLSCNP